MAPKPSNVRTAPAEPWRFSGVVTVVRGPDMAPKPPDIHRARLVAALAAGFQAHASKPIAPDELATLVQSLTRSNLGDR